jgi:hypothetical protein
VLLPYLEVLLKVLAHCCGENERLQRFIHVVLGIVGASRLGELDVISDSEFKFSGS